MKLLLCFFFMLLVCVRALPTSPSATPSPTTGSQFFCALRCLWSVLTFGPCCPTTSQPAEPHGPSPRPAPTAATTPHSTRLPGSWSTHGPSPRPARRSGVAATLSSLPTPYRGTSPSDPKMEMICICFSIDLSGAGRDEEQRRSDKRRSGLLHLFFRRRWPWW